MQPYVEVCTTQALGFATNDSWIRDYGPIFVVKNGPASSVQRPVSKDRGAAAADTGHRTLDTGQPKALHDFHFNGWGGKYEVRDLDDAVAVDEQVPRLHVAVHQPRATADGEGVVQGPAFDDQGNLWMVSIESGNIEKVTSDGQCTTAAETGGEPQGLKFHDGKLYGVDRKRGETFHTDWIRERRHTD